MTITPNDLVRREVFHCASHLVSTLSEGQGGIGYAPNMRALEDICQQAAELCTPIPDYEEPAIRDGWLWDDKAEAFLTMVDSETIADYSADWEELCNTQGIEPYEREVFEHWIISDWLADKLEAKGEKVDKDFAGLTIWARTTTGQGIASDGVIEEICAELNAFRVETCEGI